jgi:putative phosphoribosyl transferase
VIGAVSSDGEVYLRTDGELAYREITSAVTSAEREAEVVERGLRAHAEHMDLEGAWVVIVDDGVHTGASMIAAVQTTRARGACHILVAVPVGSVEGLTNVLRHVTETACLHVVHDLGTVPAWYESFPTIDDSTVASCVHRVDDARPALAANQ